MNSAADNTLAIKYNYSSSITDLDILLKSLTSLTRIAIIFDTLNLSNKKFLDNGTFFTDDDIASEKPSVFSPNCDFLLKLNVNKIDFLCCNTLLNSNFKKFYELFPYSVGASNDSTGNIFNGADWIMESTGEDIQNCYFNSNISNYHETLVYTPPTPIFTITSSTTINNWPTPIGVKYAYLIRGIKPITIRLGPNMNVTDSSQYFVIGSDNVTIIEKLK